jgi:hypothetical protein
MRTSKRVTRAIQRILLSTVLAGVALPARGSSVLPLSLEDHIRVSDAVFRGTVVRVESYWSATDGLIYTRTALRVDEAFKGRFPPVVNVVHRGGEVGGIGFRDDLSPQFKVGEERLLFVLRQCDSTLSAVQGSSSAIKLHRGNSGPFVQSNLDLLDEVRAKTNFGKMPGADVSDQAANISPDGTISAPSGDTSGSSTNGLLADSYGVPSRSSTPDRGEVISYLVDATYLPSGITLSQALGAVSNALSAWAAVSSLRFTFAGTQNFGTASPNIGTNDGVFRIQLHDYYNFITSPSILGEGGSWFTVGLLTNADWGPGGNVAGMEFNASLCGYVVLKHTNTALQSLSTLSEVLCHEIGHVIGLAHSSENPAETNPTLKQAIMYYQVHADGRGASLSNWDISTVQEVNPQINTPPYSYPRVMDITTSPYGAPNVAGINEVELRGYDLQSTNLTFLVTNATANAGNFSLSGNLLEFAPSGYSSGSRIDPSSSSYYDIIYARFSDGTNASPYITIRTISLNPDSDYPSSDGIPDAWMTTYFGHTDPRSSDKSRATDDADGDGLNNLQEYIAGMNPTNSSSAQRITLISGNTIQWQAKGYELYEVLGSTNLTAWSRMGNPIMPTSSVGTATIPITNAPCQFFRILKVP